jgi:hypothetical protein
MLWVFGLVGQLTIDMDRVRSLEQHWETRNASNTRTTHRLSKRIIERAKPIILKELARKAGLASAAKRRERARIGRGKTE